MKDQGNMPRTLFVKPSRFLPLRMLIPFLMGLCFILVLGACNRGAYITQLPQALPISYYNCIEGVARQVQEAYYDPYGHGWQAQVLYDDQIFVFKNVEIVQGMIDSRGDNYIWIDRIKCVANNPLDIKKLKVGEFVDVVGTMRGIPEDPDVVYSLLMDGCYFLPAGSLALPLPGGDVFVPGY
jgi:hypothetical protein